MTLGVRSCREGEPLTTAARIFREERCGCVPVGSSSGGVLRVLMDRDVCLALLRLDAALSEVRVAEAMIREPHCVRPDKRTEDAERNLRARHVRHVSLVDAQGQLVWVLSIDGLARAAADPRTGEARVRGRDLSRTLSRIVGPARALDVPAAPSELRSTTAALEVRGEAGAADAYNPAPCSDAS